MSDMENLKSRRVKVMRKKDFYELSSFLCNLIAVSLFGAIIGSFISNMVLWLSDNNGELNTDIHAALVLDNSVIIGVSIALIIFMLVRARYDSTSGSVTWMSFWILMLFLMLGSLAGIVTSGIVLERVSTTLTTYNYIVTMVSESLVYMMMLVIWVKIGLISEVKAGPYLKELHSINEQLYTTLVFDHIGKDKCQWEEE